MTREFEPPPRYSTLDAYVDHYARVDPDRDAVVFGGTRLSYAKLASRVEYCARGLLALGIQRGDRVAVLSTPRPEFWISFLAAGRIGAIWVGLNPKYRYEEMDYVLGDCRPVVLISLEEFEGRPYAAEVRRLRAAHACIRHVVSIGGAIDGAIGFDDMPGSAAGAAEGLRHAPARDDPALIVYTSGTTGKPKGAVLSHHGLTGGACMQTRHLRLESPAIVVSFPINHVACVADTCATTLVKGGKIVFQERFDPAESLRATAEENCSMLGGVPTMLQMQLALPDFDKYEFDALELIAWGGAAMPQDGIARLASVAPRLMSLYGLTETSANIVFAEKAFAENGRGLDTLSEAIGKPDPAVDVRVVGEDGSAVADGQPGELQFRADFFFLGYWNREDATRAAFTDDGWFCSGDIGFRRADGNLQLVGRKSDMFKSGGYNVYPREIEELLESLPEVAMAAVIGVPDPLYQEVGQAYIVPEPGFSPTPEALREACQARLANYKVPKTFSICPRLPLLPVGKVDKKALRKRADTRQKPNQSNG